MPENEKIKVKSYKCSNCGHINHFEYGCGRDIVCRRCFGYNLMEMGVYYVDYETLRKSLAGGD
jgi:DNA-directed RNA polymerase subunit RPC12/RpoP